MGKKMIRGVDMTAFTDVVFILLIFFLMYSRANIADEFPINVQLPEVASSEEKKEKRSEDKPLVVTITEDEKIFIQGNEVLVEFLKETLRTIVKKEGWKKAILQADKVSSYGNVIKILDILNGVGVKEVSLSVKEKSSL